MAGYTKVNLKDDVEDQAGVRADSYGGAGPVGGQGRRLRAPCPGRAAARPSRPALFEDLQRLAA